MLYKQELQLHGRECQELVSPFMYMRVRTVR